MDFFGGFDQPGFQIGRQAPRPQPKKKKGGRGGFGTSLISEGGALGGAATGAALGSVVPGIGTIIGAGVGGLVGGFGGRLAENKVRDDRFGVKDAAIEGAISGIAGGGPIRLAKLGAGITKGVKGGSPLVDAIETATTKVASSSARKKAGEKVAGLGDDLAVKAFRLTPTQLTNFNKRHGEDAGKVIKRYGFGNAEEITTKGIEPLQSSFDEVITNIPSISKTSLKRGLEKVYKPLTKSVNLTEKQLGQSLKTQADEILKLPGDEIDAARINELRKSFDNAVKYTQKGAPDYNVNKETADALRGLLQRTADKAGIGVGGRSFKEIGRDLSKLFDLQEMTARQSQLGRGSLPAGLTNLLGGAVGGTAGPLGALGGIVTAGAINSAPGRRAIMGGAERLSGRLLDKGQAAADNAYKIRGITPRIAAGGALNSALGGGVPQSSPLEDALVGGEQEPYIPSFMQEQMQQEESTAPQSITREQALQAMMADIQATGGKNIDKIKAVYEFANEGQQQETLQLSDSAIKNVNDLKGALSDITNLTESINSSNVSGPLTGLRAKNPYDTEAKSLQAEINRVRQVVGKALEGGVLRKEDEEKYKKILPTVTDTKAVANNKLKKLQAKIAQDLNSYVSLQQQTGKGRGSLEDALLSASSL